MPCLLDVANLAICLTHEGLNLEDSEVEMGLHKDPQRHVGGLYA